MKRVECALCGYVVGYVRAYAPGLTAAELRRRHQRSAAHRHRKEFDGLPTYIRHTLWHNRVLTRARAEQVLRDGEPLRGLARKGRDVLAHWLWPGSRSAQDAAAVE